MTFLHFLASQPSARGSEGAAEVNMSTVSASFSGVGFHLNQPSSGFSRERDLSAEFIEFFAPLHRRFSPWQESLIAERKRALAASLDGEKPTHHYPGMAIRNGWKIELPEWCQDQRNQMTGPADDAELVVKMLNSGAPGVMLDLEDSTVNEWEHQRLGVENILEALRGTLTYFDKKRDKLVGIKPSPTVIWIRPRGLHIHQGGILGDELTSASLFDVTRIAFRVDPGELKHPLAFYIPKSESADEALWWRDLFQAIAEARGWPRDYIKCMALVESHPLAFQMEEFLYNLSDHILGLNLGRWDYMASLIHFNLNDPDWVRVPKDVGQRTLVGTRAAVRTVIRYRNGVLNGKGASLLDGYMEDLATDRIYRLMIAQRMRHNGNVADDTGEVVVHTPELISKIFDEELEKLLANPGRDLGSPDTFREARRISEAMIKAEEFDPV